MVDIMFFQTLGALYLLLTLCLKLTPEFELKEGVGFLSSKHVTIHASCNKGGYVPGEKIEVVLKFNNESDKNISAVKIVLEQVCLFMVSFHFFVQSVVMDFMLLFRSPCRNVLVLYRVVIKRPSS